MRKLTLMGLAALATMAMTATTAQADVGLLVTDYIGNFCDEIVVDGDDAAGGCLIETSGSLSLDQSAPQTGFFNCQASGLDMRVDIVGNVHIANPTVHGANCVMEPCPGQAWTGALAPAGAVEDGTVEISLDACVQTYFHEGATSIPLTGELSSGYSHGATSITTGATISQGPTGFWSNGQWFGQWGSETQIVPVEYEA